MPIRLTTLRLLFASVLAAAALAASIVLAPIGFAAPVAALAAEPIRVLDQGCENRFPASVRFTVKAEGDVPITRATVYYKVADQAITSYAPVAVTPGLRTVAEHTLDLQKFYVPPGVEVRYSWRLEDEAGRKLETLWESFILDDPRFQWRTARAENVVLRWYLGGDSFGEALIEPAALALQKLRAEAGIEVGRTIKVYIYGSEADFQGAVDPGTHEWAGGRAFVREGIILIAAAPSSRDFARRTVAHELSHVVVYQATRNPYGGLPTWLDEGLAMLAEGELQPSFARALRAAIREDRLISVWTLSSSFPTSPQEAELSYAQSYSLVKFVIERYGRAGMSRLLAEFREGSTYDDALRTALGVDTYGLDDAWRASLGLLPALAATPAASAAATEATPATPLTPAPAGGGSATCALPAAVLVGSGALALFVTRGRIGW